MRITYLTLLGAVFAMQAHAQQFTWNGVITQGLFHTDGNNVYGQSADDVSLDYTEFSLNGNYKLPHDARLSAQGIYRHAGAGFDGVDLDYLFAEKGFINNFDYAVGVRLGRIKHPYGVYNETRDIAFTRPSVYVPQSIYLDILGRDSLVSFDGVGFYSHYFASQGTATLELVYGKGREDDTDNIYLSEDFVELDVQNDPDNGYTLKLSYQSNDGRFLIAYGYGRGSFKSNIPLDLNDYSPLIPFDVPPISLITEVEGDSHILSLAYSFDHWNLVVEYLESDAKSGSPAIVADAVTSQFITPDFVSSLQGFSFRNQYRGRYIQIERDLSANLKLLSRLDYSYSKESFERRTSDYMIGVRWLPRDNMLINAEYHYLDGSFWINRAENPTRAQYWNMFAASISFRF